MTIALLVKKIGKMLSSCTYSAFSNLAQFSQIFAHAYPRITTSKRWHNKAKQRYCMIQDTSIVVSYTILVVSYTFVCNNLHQSPILFDI